MSFYLWLAVAVIVVPLLLVASYAVYIIHVRRQYSHIPGPPVSSFFSGHTNDVAAIIKEKKIVLEQLFLEWHIKYGKVIVCWFRQYPFVVTVDPEMVKEILVSKNLPKFPLGYKVMAAPFGERFLGQGLATDLDHEHWKGRRTLLNPAFHRQQLKDSMSAFNASATTFLDKLLQFADGTTEVAMAKEFSRVTLDVICKVAFGMNLDVVNAKDERLMQSITTALQGAEYATFHPWSKFNIFSYSYQSEVIASIKFVRDTGRKVINARCEAIQRGDQVHNDILTHIVRSADKDPSITMEDMLDDFVTFYFAGHETTANLLAFCLLELGFHPDIQERLYEEVASVLGEKTEVAFDDLAKLHHMGEVLKETLRLYPTATGSARITVKDEDIGSYKIPGGTLIVTSSFASGHYPEFWDNPEEFDPYRFGDEEMNKRSHYTYFPFSLGPRNCIGQHFAIMEAKVILARFLQTFKFRLSPDQTRYLVKALTLRPRDSVSVVLTKRPDIF